jgi:hypothetical protein
MRGFLRRAVGHPVFRDVSEAPPNNGLKRTRPRFAWSLAA